MEAVDLSEIQLHHIYYISGLLACTKIYYLGKSINNHKDGVSLPFWVLGKPNTKSMLTFIYGPSEIGRGIYNLALVADPFDT
jgi:hypothetical protein